MPGFQFSRRAAGPKACRHVWLDPSQKTICVRCGPVTRKPSKYKNQKQIVDGIEFDSKREAVEWFAHRVLERAGQIRDLRRQVEYRCLVNGVYILSYFSDFEYDDLTGRRHVVDIKSDSTEQNPVFIIKRKLVWACHKIKIEVRK
jgi:hypothetical protein